MKETLGPRTRSFRASSIYFGLAEMRYRWARLDSKPPCVLLQFNWRVSRVSLCWVGQTLLSVPHDPVTRQADRKECLSYQNLTGKRTPCKHVDAIARGRQIWQPISRAEAEGRRSETRWCRPGRNLAAGRLPGLLWHEKTTDECAGSAHEKKQCGLPPWNGLANCPGRNPPPRFPRPQSGNFLARPRTAPPENC